MSTEATPYDENLLREVRLAIYRSFAEHGQGPAPSELCRGFGLTPRELDRLVRHLADERSALVLMPDSAYVWMAEPFSAVPTHFPVRSGARRWFGNCIWDALAILALLELDGEVETFSPVDGTPLCFRVESGHLQPIEASIHFAVPARDWWRSIGFT
ncbi:MAG: alkylmercury lyase family protein [Holophagales bacterium]|nr:alkylmercury lyase family protein [Holophagales bacterium]